MLVEQGVKPGLELVVLEENRDFERWIMVGRDGWPTSTEAALLLPTYRVITYPNNTYGWEINLERNPNFPPHIIAACNHYAEANRCWGSLEGENFEAWIHVSRLYVLPGKQLHYGSCVHRGKKYLETLSLWHDYYDTQGNWFSTQLERVYDLQVLLHLEQAMLERREGWR